MPVGRPFQYDPQLTNVVNAQPLFSFVAEQALPVVTTQRDTFKYTHIPTGQFFKLPETKVGRRGQANEVVFAGKEESGYTEPHALKAPVPLSDQAHATQYFDPRATASTGVNHLIDLGREKEAADFLFDSANYNAAQVETLTSTDKWSDDASDPTRKVLLAKAAMKVKPNVMIMGTDVATYLMMHPKLIKAFNRNEGDEGVVSMAWLASFWGFQRILIGDAYYDPANLGQDPSLTKVWGNRVAMVHYNPRQMFTASGAVQLLTFAATFVRLLRGQRKLVATWTDPDAGAEGVEYIRVAEERRVQSIAPDLGYLFIDAVTAIS